MNIQRRILLKGSIAAGSLGVAVGAGLLAPKMVLAAWNEAAFAAKEVPDALNARLGSSGAGDCFNRDGRGRKRSGHSR